MCPKEVGNVLHFSADVVASDDCGRRVFRESQRREMVPIPAAHDTR
jgi:hypothetical protein